jgi:hypothetical protein
LYNCVNISMVSLWGSKKADDENEAVTAAPPHDDYEREDPDERTRLLPPRPAAPHSDGYLDPDDPAVSTQAPVHVLKHQLTHSTGLSV